MKLISAILFACVAAVALLHSVYGTSLPISATDAAPELNPESKSKTVPISEPQAAQNRTVAEIFSDTPFDNEKSASNVTVTEVISAEAVENEELGAMGPANIPLLLPGFVERSANPDPLAQASTSSGSNAFVGSIDHMVQDRTAETNQE